MKSEPEAPSAKQHIYQRMLMMVAQFRCLQSVETVTEEGRKLLADLFWQADLLHGIPQVIVSQEFTEDDVGFLNRHARYFLTNATASSQYRFYKVMIHHLFQLVPSHLRDKLQWPGPTLDDSDQAYLNRA